MLQPLSNNWQDVYHANLANCLVAKDGELINHAWMVEDVADYDSRHLTSVSKNFNEKFSELFFEWALTGEAPIPEAMLEMNPKARNFGTVFTKPGYRQTTVQYGGRILEQLPYVLDILQRTEGTTRRANIMILGAEDRHVGIARELGETNCEYPCAMGYNLRIRDNRLDLVATLRSNNYTTTVCQDFFVITLLQQYIAEQLGIEAGNYYHSTQSGHVFSYDRDRARTILAEYIGRMEGLPQQQSKWRIYCGMPQD